MFLAIDVCVKKPWKRVVYSQRFRRDSIMYDCFGMADEETPRDTRWEKSDARRVAKANTIIARWQRQLSNLPPTNDNFDLFTLIIYYPDPKYTHRFVDDIARYSGVSNGFCWSMRATSPWTLAGYRKMTRLNVLAFEAKEKAALLPSNERDIRLLLEFGVRFLILAPRNSLTQKLAQEVGECTCCDPVKQYVLARPCQVFGDVPCTRIVTRHEVEGEFLGREWALLEEWKQEDAKGREATSDERVMYY